MNKYRCYLRKLCLVLMLLPVAAATAAEFLPPDQAFQFSARLSGEDTLELSWSSANGYYLYRDKTKISVSPADVTLGDYTLPPGTDHNDKYFGHLQIYDSRTVSVKIPLHFKGKKPDQIVVSSKYQGCAKAGICYPPTTKAIAISLSGEALASAAAPEVPTAANPFLAAQAPALSEQDRFAQLLHGSLWLTVALFFMAGLGLSLTPCVFPMIPILSAIIVGQDKLAKGAGGFALAATYVMGMALTYTVVGVIAGMTGAYLQAFFQDPWVLVGFSLVFALLSLSMFGFYELQMPASLQSKLSGMGKGGNIAGTFIMGALSALIIGPCVAAPLAGALLYISQTGDVLLGGISLFALSIGMGVPLLLIGASAGRLLPKAGAWMETVKVFFGVTLLAVAIWMLSRIIPAWASMALWSVLLVIYAVHLRALDSLGDSASGWTRVGKGVGVLLLVYGLLLGIGALSGASDPLRPLQGMASSGREASEAAETSAFTTVTQAAELEELLVTSQGRWVLLDFYADWCVECVHMEKTTFADPQVLALLKSFVLIRVDVTENSAEQRQILQKYKLIGPPAILFFTPDGEEEREHRVVGYLNSDDFMAQLRQLGVD